MGNDDAHDAEADVDRVPDRSGDDPPEWSESGPSQGPGRPEDVAGVATDRTPGWLDERMAGLLVVVGVIMVFVPEPVTTMLGLGFVVGGLLLWLTDLFE